MHGGTPFSRSWALPEKMISMPRILAPPLSRQQSCRDQVIMAGKRMGKLRQRDRGRPFQLSKDCPRSTAISKPSGKPD